ncbi:MAG TPA: type II toxin-antitoxin system PemK/MazF family toxin [Clostridiaceae bacterium]|nr:type II toxin-antitoxin system PemK/MazF family toxin [Clostridiaceae bacterium]
MVNYRWNIFWADLYPAKGSEQCGKRPVLVISSEAVNSVLPVVTVLPLTSVKPGRHVYPTEAYLPYKLTGLSKDSIAMAHQIRSISIQRLREQCGAIDDIELRDKVKEAIRLYLGL